MFEINMLCIYGDPINFNGNGAILVVLKVRGISENDFNILKKTCCH